MNATTWDTVLNETAQDAIRAAFAAAGPSNYTAALDEMEQPNGWQTWVVGLAFITLCSFSAPIGIMLLPCLAKWLYERMMAFLIALGIGTLSGSCFFIMIPQAFGLTQIQGGLGYTTKSWIIVGSLYGFFALDRLLCYVFEFRRRRVKRKIHASTLKTVMENNRQDTVETVVSDEEGFGQPGNSNSNLSTRNELEIAVLNNIIARTFSTRRRVAVVHVDSIQCNNDDMNALKSAPVSPGGSRRVNSETLRRVNSDLDHLGNISTAYSNMGNGTTAIPLDHPHHQNNHNHNNNNNNDKDNTSVNTLAVPGMTNIEKDDDTLSVSVQVVEKRVVDPKDFEIASVAYIIILGSSINNFLDGMSMGAAFADSLLRGVSIGISSFSQQFPQEVGTLAILANSGLGIKRTLLVNLVPAFLSYLGFTIGVLLDNVDESYDTYVFSVSAGMYLYVFLGTLIPEVRNTTEELVKTNIKESYLVTFLQFLGMGGGVTFMYFMNKLNDVELS